MVSLGVSEGHKLAHDWTFWTSSMRGAPEFNCHEQFNSIEAFWELFPKHRFSDLTDRTSLHVFKDDIQPIWEDAKNLNGGHFKITARTQERTESLWLEVVLNLIGQHFPYRDFVNGASIMANRSGHNLVKVWISIVKKPVVQALRDFIRAALKEADYFADDVRLVPHKLVVKGAGKKIPGISKDAGPESPPALKVSACNSNTDFSLLRSPAVEPMVSARRRSTNSNCLLYTQLLLSAPTVGGPISSQAKDFFGASPLPQSLSQMSLDSFSISGGTFSGLPSYASSEPGPSSSVHTPRSQHGTSFEGFRRGKSRRSSSLGSHVHIPCSDDQVSEGYVHYPYGEDHLSASLGRLSQLSASFSGLSASRSTVGSELGYSSLPDTPRSQASVETVEAPCGSCPPSPYFPPYTAWASWEGYVAAPSHWTALPHVPHSAPPVQHGGASDSLDYASAPMTPVDSHGNPKPHRRTWSTETYAFMENLYAPRSPMLTEWDDSPTETQHSCSTETHGYRHEPYSLSASIVPICNGEA